MEVKVRFILFFLLSVGGANSLTTFTFKNNCNYTVWMGLASNKYRPGLPVTGLKIPINGSQTIDAPSAPWSGIIWARTHCTNHPDGRLVCATGDCKTGKVQCAGSWFTPPITLLEFTIGGNSSENDFYDVSLVAGFNVPVSVIPEGVGGADCVTGSCPTDINTICPPELQVKDVSGNTIGCKSACGAFLDPKYCCSKCPPNNYTDVFKKACPMAISYPYDNARFKCSAPNYAINFCPSV